MERSAVTSSNLASVGYDAETQTLEVEFGNGGVYQYFDVPAGVYQSLVAAFSVGTYFDLNVKKAGYRHRQVSS